MAFIEGSLSAVTDALVRRAEQITAMWELPWEVKMERASGGLFERLHRLLPLTSVRSTKTLVSATRSGWIAYVPNGFPAADVHAEPEFLSGALETRAVSVVLANPIRGKVLGSFQFVHCDGRTGELKVRAVYAHKESRWVFGEHGEVLPFEDTSSYALPRVRDRVTPELIERYCHHLGIDLFDVDYYRGDGSVIHTYPPPDCQMYPVFPNVSSERKP